MTGPNSRADDGGAKDSPPSTGAAAPTEQAADPAQAHIALTLKHRRPLIACRFDPSGRWLFASSEDQSVVRWDLTAEKPEGTKASLTAHDSWVHALAATPDGATLLT